MRLLVGLLPSSRNSWTLWRTVSLARPVSLVNRVPRVLLARRVTQGRVDLLVRVDRRGRKVRRVTTVLTAQMVTPARRVNLVPLVSKDPRVRRATRVTLVLV